jgi:hypothetical protein
MRLIGVMLILFVAVVGLVALVGSYDGVDFGEIASLTVDAEPCDVGLDANACASIEPCKEKKKRKAELFTYADVLNPASANIEHMVNFEHEANQRAGKMRRDLTRVCDVSNWCNRRPATGSGRFAGACT